MEYVSSIERVLLARERQEGRNEERTEMLLNLLTLRFGPVPEARQARIRQADQQQIKAWFNQASTAATLDEVFPPLPH